MGQSTSFFPLTSQPCRRCGAEVYETARDEGMPTATTAPLCGRCWKLPIYAGLEISDEFKGGCYRHDLRRGYAAG